MSTEYFSIGKIAKLKNISIKALRYYDEIGIFTPAYINPLTNYRYYTMEQLPMLDAVNLCLQLGIPLKTLPTYVKGDFFDFSALLSDTRKLAEEKIHGIQLALDKIEEACAPVSPNTITNTVSVASPAIKTDSAITETHNIRQPVSFKQDVYLLALQLSQDQLPPYDGFILKLFIFARQKNLTLENPSCTLYRYENSAWKKYLCLKLISTNSITPDLGTPDFSLFHIPAGEYTKRLYKKSIEYPSSESISTFGNYPEDFSPSLLEQRLTDFVEESEYTYELINLFTQRLDTL